MHPHLQIQVELFRQGPKRLGLEVHKPELKLESPDILARFATGHPVAEIAQPEYQVGQLIAPTNNWLNDFVDIGPQRSSARKMATFVNVRRSICLRLRPPRVIAGTRILQVPQARRPSGEHRVF